MFLKKQGKKPNVYLAFRDLEKAFDRITQKCRTAQEIETLILIIYISHLHTLCIWYGIDTQLLLAFYRMFILTILYQQFHIFFSVK